MAEIQHIHSDYMLVLSVLLRIKVTAAVKMMLPIWPMCTICNPDLRVGKVVYTH